MSAGNPDQPRPAGALSPAADDDAELLARAEAILRPVLRHARVWAQVAAEDPLQRARCVGLLSTDLHRAIDASPRDVMVLLAELAMRLAERERAEAPT